MSVTIAWIARGSPAFTKVRSLRRPTYSVGRVDEHARARRPRLAVHVGDGGLGGHRHRQVGPGAVGSTEVDLQVLRAVGVGGAVVAVDVDVLARTGTCPQHGCGKRVTSSHHGVHSPKLKASHPGGA